MSIPVLPSLGSVATLTIDIEEVTIS